MVEKQKLVLQHKALLLRQARGWQRLQVRRRRRRVMT